MGGNSSSGGGGEGPANRYQKPPKKSVVTKIKDGASAMVTARKKMAYNVANIIPGMKKGLIKNRTDYKKYLDKRGGSPDFLSTDDDTLSSFDTFEKVRTYEPTGGALNYSDYLAKEKGNYNLQQSGDVGGMNTKGGEGNLKNELSVTSSTTLAKADAIANSPTTVEVSQSSAVDAAPYDLRKTKKKGKSMTILTSSKGVQQDDKLTLGKKSLLGNA
tara:strand:- start:77 stop:724 length:648 start_codon:yes stop_codon:yes gene_type:complete